MRITPVRAASLLPVFLAFLTGTIPARAAETKLPRPPGPYVALRMQVFEGPAPGDETSAEPTGEQRGSGVVIAREDGGEWLVLTNAHVVDAEDETKHVVPQVYAGGEWRGGTVVASDADADLALIRFRFPQELKTAEVSTDPPGDRVEVETHGFAGGRKYTEREGELRRDLPLEGGSLATAPRRYFIRTKFAPGESGGAVTIGDRLVALIHGNDCDAGWGICVDQPSIAEFLAPFLKPAETTE